MTLHPQLVNNFSKIIFTPKYVDSRALSSIVASRIYALFVVKSTSAKILRAPILPTPPLLFPASLRFKLGGLKSNKISWRCTIQVQVEVQGYKYLSSYMEEWGSRIAASGSLLHTFASLFSEYKRIFEPHSALQCNLNPRIRDPSSVWPNQSHFSFVSLPFCHSRIDMIMRISLVAKCRRHIIKTQSMREQSPEVTVFSF